MEKNVYSIEEIFAGKIFNVPDYQRGYTWEKIHCEDLLDDLDLLPEKFNHYTGTIVLHSNKQEIIDSEGSKFIGHDLVDGQQRITTIVILLQTLQSFIQTNPKYQDLTAGITKKFLFAARLSDNNPFYKLTLNEDCKEFFKTDILGQPGVTGAKIKSHQLLLVAKTTFNDYLKSKQEELGERFDKWIIDYYNKITQRLKLGIYKVDDATEVGVIFEVMNNRGKNLTELEKVKNYLFYLVSKINLQTRNELTALINKTWSNIYQRFMSANLGADSENQLLRAHWLMYSNHNKRDWSGSKSIKAKFNLKSYHNRDLDLLNDLTNYVQSLNEGSIAYADLEKPERTDAFNAYSNEDERRSVIFHSAKLLRTKTVASFRPFLIACRLKYPNNALYYLELIQLIEKFAFRVYNMEHKRADTGQTTIFKIAFELYNNTIDFEISLRQFKSLLKGYSSQKTFDKFWTFDPDDNNWYKWGGTLKYFLYEYEEFRAKGNPLAVTWSYFTEKKLENSIEHILPQTSEGIDNYWPQRFKPDEIKILIHDLGNLCLTFNNSSYKNFGFDRKRGTPNQEKPCYAKSSLNQERELTKYKEWTPYTIEKRRNILFDWAKDRWFVDLSDLDETEIMEEEIDNLTNDEENIVED